MTGRSGGRSAAMAVGWFASGDLVSFGLEISTHALSQSRRRGIPTDVVHLVSAFGGSLRRTGLEFCVLRQRDVLEAPAALRSRLAKWVNTVVLIDDTVSGPAQVITIYRNRHALHAICRKVKYRRSAKRYGQDPRARTEREQSSLKFRDWHL